MPDGVLLRPLEVAVVTREQRRMTGVWVDHVRADRRRLVAAGRVSTASRHGPTDGYGSGMENLEARLDDARYHADRFDRLALEAMAAGGR